MKVHDHVDELKIMLDVWRGLKQNVIEDKTKEWCKRLRMPTEDTLSI